MDPSDTEHPDDELDFTRPGALPARTPTPERVEQARAEARHVAPQLHESGYYVSIAKHAESRVPPRSGGKYAVLIVEDDGDLAQLLIDIFTLSAFEVHWASNRAEINAELNRRPGPDIILLDILLPDCNGLEILRRLRHHSRLATMPVILMTGKAEPEDVVAGLAAGADGYVSKPFKPSGLVKAVNSVLGRV